MLLEGRNAIVTGGSQGIGTAVSLMLAREGAHVCLTYRSHREEAEMVVKQIEGMGRKAICVKCDIASFSEAEAVVKAALETFGKIDILVNNAGMNWDGVCWKMTEEQWDRVLEVNLKGYFNFTRHTAPLFKEQKSGRIINVTSINGMRGKFGQSNYSASKAGIIGLMHYYAAQLAKEGITANAIAPGPISTDMAAGLPQLRPDLIPVGRFGTPGEVAEVAVLLACNGYLTGQTINVNGGRYQG